MSQLRISVPSILLNNQLIMIKPNSLVVHDGRGERSVQTQSAGNGVVDTVIGINAETLIGKVEFEIMNTSQNVELAMATRDNLSANTLVVQYNDGTSKSLSYTNMTVTNDPDYSLTQDGTIKLEFQGDKPV